MIFFFIKETMGWGDNKRKKGRKNTKKVVICGGGWL
jgi:hypothetical protein